MLKVDEFLPYDEASAFRVVKNPPTLAGDFNVTVTITNPNWYAITLRDATIQVRAHDSCTY